MYLNSKQARKYLRSKEKHEPDGIKYDGRTKKEILQQFDRWHFTVAIPAIPRVLELMLADGIEEAKFTRPFLVNDLPVEIVLKAVTTPETLTDGQVDVLARAYSWSKDDFKYCGLTGAYRPVLYKLENWHPADTDHVEAVL